MRNDQQTTRIGKPVSGSVSSSVFASRAGAAMLLLLCSACGGRVVGWPAGLSSPPTVTWVTPEDGEQDVALNTTPMATFSQPMDPDTLLQGNFTVSDGNSLILGGVTPSGLAGVQFSPTFDLEADTEYTATLSTDIRDTAGRALAEDFTWTFTTGSDLDLQAPRVIFTVPLDGADDVSVNADVYATFSEPMAPGSIDATSFSLQGPDGDRVSGEVDYDTASQTGSFIPLDALVEGGTYSDGVRGRDGSGRKPDGGGVRLVLYGAR